MKLICTSRSREFMQRMNIDDKDALRAAVKEIQGRLFDTTDSEENSRPKIEMVSDNLYFVYKIHRAQVFIIQLGYCSELNDELCLSVKMLVDADKYDGPYFANLQDGTQVLIGLSNDLLDISEASTGSSLEQILEHEDTIASLNTDPYLSAAGYTDPFTNGSAPAFEVNCGMFTVRPSNAPEAMPLLGWTTQQVNDLNGNGISDILWRNGDSASAIWTLNGEQSPSVSDLTNSSSLDGSLSIQRGCFNGKYVDSDPLWHTSNGALALSIIDTTDTIWAGEWTIQGVGDFNGDGRADILWRNGDGATAMWALHGNPNQSIFGHADTFPSGGWLIQSDGGFNGDSNSDYYVIGPDGSTMTFKVLPTVLRDDSLFKA